MRTVVDDGCYEVPAGGLSSGLPPEEIVQRELFEEIGGTAAELGYFGQFYTLNGISDEGAYVYLVAGVGPDELFEPMEMRLVLVDESLRMARDGGISDGLSAWELLWCQPLLGLQF